MAPMQMAMAMAMLMGATGLRVATRAECPWTNINHLLLMLVLSLKMLLPVRNVPKNFIPLLMQVRYFMLRSAGICFALLALKNILMISLLIRLETLFVLLKIAKKI